MQCELISHHGSLALLNQGSVSNKLFRDYLCASEYFRYNRGIDTYS